MLRAVVIALLWLAQAFVPALAQVPSDAPPLAQRLTPEVVAKVFPGVTRVEVLNDGGPAAAAAYADKELKGYLFSTLDVLRAPGYSSTPFDAIAGVTLEGKLTGATVLFHREPYILGDDRRTQLLGMFLDHLNGVEAKLDATGAYDPTYVTGATISARAMRNAVQESGSLVLRYRTGNRVVTEPTVNLYSFRPQSMAELQTDGSVVRLLVTNAELSAAMERSGLAGMQPEVPTGRGGPNEAYLDLRLGLATPPMIGRKAAGQRGFQLLQTGHQIGRAHV